MSGKVFFDSNILIYAYDTRDPNKQNQAQAGLTCYDSIDDAH